MPRPHRIPSIRLGARGAACALLLALALGPAGAESLPDLSPAPKSSRFT